MNSLRLGLAVRPHPVDLGLVAVLSALNVAVGAAEGDPPRWLLAAALLPVPLLWRRRHPVPAAAVTALLAALLVTGFAGGPHPLPLMLVLVVALYSVACYEQRLGAALGGGMLLALGGSADILAFGPSGTDDAFWMWRIPEFVLAWLVGRAFYRRRREVDDLEGHARDLARLQQARIASAIDAERARLARELHDIVAHSVSVMVVQAGAARHALGPQPAAVAESLAHIQDIGRQTVVELRRLLGVLKSPTGEPMTSPQPSLADIDELATRMSAAGLPVEVTVTGARRHVPSSVDLSAYRVVQEGLTNALKHADASHVSVEVVYKPDALEVSVVDDGRGAGGSANGEGSGLLGVQERTALFGGQFEAGNRPEGGFALRALLPFDPEPR